MSAWSAFYPDVLAEVLGAPEFIVDNALRNAAITFCERTHIWTQMLDPIDSVANQMEYDLDVPTRTNLVEIQAVWYSGRRIDPKSPRFLETTYADWTAETGTPAFYTQETPEVLLLVPMPTESLSESIKVRASLKPSSTATGVEDWIFARHRLDIAAGCKAALMTMTDQVWFSPDRSNHYRALFEAAIEKTTKSAANGLTAARPRFTGGFC